MSKTTKTIFYALPLVLGMVFVGILVSQKLAKKEMLIYGPLPQFELTDHKGQVANQDILKDKVGVINFMFTTCQGICPTLNKEMNKLQKAFARFHDFQLVSISVDPVNDTPEQLKNWTETMGVQTDNWTFLTGAHASIKTLLVDGLKVGFPDQPQAHTDRFVLIDKKGDIRGYYRLARPETLEQLRVDIFGLLRG